MISSLLTKMSNKPRMFRMLLLTVCAFSLAATLVRAEITNGAATNSVAPESSAQRDARMKWWREARFGLFIHWGLYSVPAGQLRRMDSGTNPHASQPI